MAGGGIIIDEVIAGALTAIAVIPVRNTGKATGATAPYRPPVWAKPALTSILAPHGRVPDSSSQDGIIHVTSQAAILYVFDAVLRGNHVQTLTKTQHPIQTGANIADHAYKQPARVTLEIGMSDAMDAYGTNMWTSAPSKSVAAWQTLLQLQTERVPVTLTTRLDTYTNMLIEDLQASEDHRSRFGLRATVTFGQIFTATVATQTISARPQTTDLSGSGKKQGEAPSDTIIQQHQVPDATSGGYSNAGDWSSGALTGKES